MRYRFVPRWQYLDSEDMIHLFCLFDIKVHDSRMKDRDFPPRLKRLFTRKGFFWLWEGRPDWLEHDDIAFLSRFLDIVVPQADAEAPAFPTRMRAHLAQRGDGDYDWRPDVRLLSCDEVPRMLQWLDFTIPDERFMAGNFPARLKSHFRGEERQAA